MLQFHLRNRSSLVPSYSCIWIRLDLHKLDVDGFHAETVFAEVCKFIVSKPYSMGVLNCSYLGSCEICFLQVIQVKENVLAV